MSKTYDVLVCAPHPDDAEFGMAGTMIKFVKAGLKVIHIALTQSEMSTHGDIARRRQEFNRACEVIGCDGQMLDFPDTGIENNRESRIKLARVIREIKPKIVFAPYHTNPVGELRGLAHVDHYTAGSLIRDALKMARLARTVPDMPPHNVDKLYFFMLPKAVRATLFVDVSDVIEQTMNAISAYDSQMAIGYKDNHIRDSLKTRRAAVGIELGVKYAEQFTTELPLTLAPADFLRL